MVEAKPPATPEGMTGGSCCQLATGVEGVSPIGEGFQNDTNLVSFIDGLKIQTNWSDPI
jgi:hypothetical protein